METNFPEELFQDLKKPRVFQNKKIDELPIDTPLRLTKHCEVIDGQELIDQNYLGAGCTKVNATLLAGTIIHTQEDPDYPRSWLLCTDHSSYRVQYNLIISAEEIDPMRLRSNELEEAQDFVAFLGEKAGLSFTQLRKVLEVFEDVPMEKLLPFIENLGNNRDNIRRILMAKSGAINTTNKDRKAALVSLELHEPEKEN